MIYIITKGCYSDYHICAATSDKDRAEKLKMLFSDSSEDAYIEEFEDGASGIDEERFVRPFRVQIYKKFKRDTSGISKFRLESGENVRQYTQVLKPNQVFEQKIYFTPNDGGGTSLIMYTLADDEDHALKIARDVWAQECAKAFKL